MGVFLVTTHRFTEESGPKDGSWSRGSSPSIRSCDKVAPQKKTEDAPIDYPSPPPRCCSFWAKQSGNLNRDPRSSMGAWLLWIIGRSACLCFPWRSFLMGARSNQLFQWTSTEILGVQDGPCAQQDQTCARKLLQRGKSALCFLHVTKGICQHPLLLHEETERAHRAVLCPFLRYTLCRMKP